MKRLLEIPHRMDDHACMWSGVEECFLHPPVGITGCRGFDKAAAVLDAMRAGYEALSV